MKILAIDLGGTHATCALVEGRQILARETVPLPPAASLADTLPVLAEPLDRLQSSVRADAIGFGFCGLVDSRRTRIASTNGKYVDGPALDLSQWARERFSLPLRLDNDARLALLGERHAGAAQGETDVVMFTLGTGIGGVAMISGHLLRGKHDQAGVLGGHIPVSLSNRRCTCGGLGCAEAEASGWALPGIASEWPGFSSSALAGQPVNFQNLFACAATGDRISREIVDHCLRVWAAAAVAAIHSFDPELLIYGGGVMQSAAAILPYIENYVRDNAWTPWGTVRVRAAELGNDAALLGVIPLFEQESPLVR